MFIFVDVFDSTVCSGAVPEKGGFQRMFVYIVLRVFMFRLTFVFAPSCFVLFLRVTSSNCNNNVVVFSCPYSQPDRVYSDLPVPQSPSWQNVGSILGPKIRTLLVILGVIFLGLRFWVLFGPTLRALLGPLRALQGT